MDIIDKIDLYLVEKATETYKGYDMRQGDREVYFIDKVDGKTTRVAAKNIRQLKKKIDQFINELSSDLKATGTAVGARMMQSPVEKAIVRKKRKTKLDRKELTDDQTSQTVMK